MGEQLGHEAAVGAREHDLRALGLATNVIDVAADPIADLEVLAGDRLVAADHALAPAKVDDDVAVFDPLDGAVDDLANPVLELLVLVLALGLAHLTHHHLAGHLGLHPADLEQGQDFLVGLAHEGVLVGRLGVGQGLVGVGVLDLLVVADHRNHPLDGGLAGLGIDVDADVVLGAIAGAGGLLHSLLDRLDDDFLFDRLLAGDRLGDLQELGAVRGNAGEGHSSTPWKYRFRLPPIVRIGCGPRAGRRRVASACR